MDVFCVSVESCLMKKVSLKFVVRVELWAFYGGDA